MLQQQVYSSLILIFCFNKTSFGLAWYKDFGKWKPQSRGHNVNMLCIQKAYDNIIFIADNKNTRHMWYNDLFPSWWLLWKFALMYIQWVYEVYTLLLCNASHLCLSDFLSLFLPCCLLFFYLKIICLSTFLKLYSLTYTKLYIETPYMQLFFI